MYFLLVSAAKYDISSGVAKKAPLQSKCLLKSQEFQTRTLACACVCMCVRAWVRVRIRNVPKKQ